MASRRRTGTRVTFSADRGVFMISVAAELAEMHPQTLRMYEARGLIEPKRSPKGTRLYSQDDVDKLRRIQEMTNELGLNLAGVERVLELEEQLERASRRLEQLERRSSDMRRQMQEEMERIRASVRAELVPYRRIATDLVHLRPAQQAAAGREAAGRRKPAGRPIPVERDDG
jgi:MerR family transcriptional regulator/heat shock protein HspR